MNFSKHGMKILLDTTYLPPVLGVEVFLRLKRI